MHNTAQLQSLLQAPRDTAQDRGTNKDQENGTARVQENGETAPTVKTTPEDKKRSAPAPTVKTTPEDKKRSVPGDPGDDTKSPAKKSHNAALEELQSKVCDLERNLAFAEKKIADLKKKYDSMWLWYLKKKQDDDEWDSDGNGGGDDPIDHFA